MGGDQHLLLLQEIETRGLVDAAAALETVLSDDAQPQWLRMSFVEEDPTATSSSREGRCDQCLETHTEVLPFSIFPCSQLPPRFGFMRAILEKALLCSSCLPHVQIAAQYLDITMYMGSNSTHHEPTAMDLNTMYLEKALRDRLKLEISYNNKGGAYEEWATGRYIYRDKWGGRPAVSYKTAAEMKSYWAQAGMPSTEHSEEIHLN